MRCPAALLAATLLSACGNDVERAAPAARVAPAKIVFAPAQQTDEELLDLVNAGRIPATLVDDYIYDARRSQLEKTAVNRDVAVSQDQEIAWVTRQESARLLALINEFFSTHRLAF